MLGTLFVQIPLDINRDSLKSHTLCGAKNINKLRVPCHLAFSVCCPIRPNIYGKHGRLLVNMPCTWCMHVCNVKMFTNKTIYVIRFLTFLHLAKYIMNVFPQKMHGQRGLPNAVCIYSTRSNSAISVFVRIADYIRVTDCLTAEMHSAQAWLIWGNSQKTELSMVSKGVKASSGGQRGLISLSGSTAWSELSLSAPANYIRKCCALAHMSDGLEFESWPLPCTHKNFVANAITRLKCQKALSLKADLWPEKSFPLILTFSHCVQT